MSNLTEDEMPGNVTLGRSGPFCDIGFASKPEPKRRKPKPIGLDWRVYARDDSNGVINYTTSKGPEIDEVVIDEWFHLERMGGKDQAYFLRIAGAEVNVWFDRSGKPSVRINDVAAADLQKQVAALTKQLDQTESELITLRAGLRGAF